MGRGSTETEAIRFSTRSKSIGSRKRAFIFRFCIQEPVCGNRS